MLAQPKKPKNKFNFDNILSLNRYLDLSNKKEIDKWFKLVSEHTGMIYTPANEKEYAQLTQRFSNSCVFFWFNDDLNGFGFKVIIDDEVYFHDAYEFSDKVNIFTKFMSDINNYIKWHSVRDVIDELKKINNGIKQYYIDKKKRELLEDFQ